MSQIDRTHDHSPDFDQSLQAVLGLARLLSEVETLGPASEAAGAGTDLSMPSPSSSYDDPASLAVLGVIALACELRPMVEALRSGSRLPLNVGEHAEQDGETQRLTMEGGGARRIHLGRAGLLR